MDMIRGFVKLAFLAVGLVLVYLFINGVVGSVNGKLQDSRDNDAGANIIASGISKEPFGDQIEEVKRGDQIFYNITIRRQEGKPCFVNTSWRWTLHLPSGNSVMWNTDDGQFYTGDKNENLSQAVTVPEKLLPGNYTLTRLSTFKCGNVPDYARTVRDSKLIVK
jgi:hypothetical protein